MLAPASSQHPVEASPPAASRDGTPIRPDLPAVGPFAAVAGGGGRNRTGAGGRGRSGPALRSSTLALRYVGFAALSTGANLLAQAAAVRLSPGAPLVFSVVAGTGTGFVLKYLLDKHLIFLDGTAGYAAEAYKVVLYGLFSVFTTLLFWAFEFGFDAVWGGGARYVGAVIGLAIGYLLKYQLDRRFVFGAARPSSRAITDRTGRAPSR